MPERGCGFQKFLGLELEFEAAARARAPLLMDATVPQLGGFRFFYVLPLSPTRLLVEDTRFSLDPRARPRRAAPRGAELRRRASAAWRARAARGVAACCRCRWAGRRTAPRSLTAARRLPRRLLPSRDRLLVPGRAPARATHRGARAARRSSTAICIALHRAHARRSATRAGSTGCSSTASTPEDMWRVFERFYRLPEALDPSLLRDVAVAGRPRAHPAGRPPGGLKLGAALSPRRPA